MLLGRPSSADRKVWYKRKAHVLVQSVKPELLHHFSPFRCRHRRWLWHIYVTPSQRSCHVKRSLIRTNCLRQRAARIPNAKKWFWTPPLFTIFLIQGSFFYNWFLLMHFRIPFTFLCSLWKFNYNVLTSMLGKWRIFHLF